MATSVIKRLLQDPKLPLRTLVGSTPTRLGVTEFITQMCEVKSLYAHYEPVLATPAMRAGTAYHARLEKAVMAKHLPVVPDGTVLSDEDTYALKLIQMAIAFNLLAEGQSVRELRVVGEVPIGNTFITVTGIIDGVDHDRHSTLHLSDTKTSLSIGQPPDWKLRLAYHQLLVYHMLLNQMLVGPMSTAALIPKLRRENLNSDAQLHDVLRSYGYTTLERLYWTVHGAVASAAASRLQVGNELTVEYMQIKEHKKYEITLLYDQQVLDEMIAFRQELWMQQREPLAVNPDNYTACGSCQFKDECAVLSRLGL